MLPSPDVPHRAAAAPVVQQGDARNLSALPAAFFDLIVTSPPYWQRRDYGHPDQLGQEPTPDAFVHALAETVDAWAPLLAPHGALFLNLADTYAGGFLAGVPVAFEQAMRARGWRAAHRIVWSKTTSVPQPLPTRLTSRHELVLHLVPPRTKAFHFDRYALACHAPEAEIGDVWHLAQGRSTRGHPAPFPEELARRALLLGCPERVCTACGVPFGRQVAPSPTLDPSRKQARRAMALFEEKSLTAEHLAAIRAVGISDTGMGRRLQNGAGKNRARVQALADEAKAALGGYYREFTFAPKQHVGWTRCACRAETRPGRVLDPFAGSNTTLRAAAALGFDAWGTDLSPHPL